MAEEHKFPITASVDIGAKVEVRAEIPPSSSGRLIDALTDILRPFSEARGFRADQIRLQREDVLIQIARKAAERISVEQSTIQPLPTKTLVPLLEKASLEDPSDEEMIDRWANLLAQESLMPGLNRRWCVDILASINSEEAQLLDEIFFEHTERAAFDFDNYSSAAADQDFYNMLDSVSHVEEKDTKHILSSFQGMSWFFHGNDIPNTEEFSLQYVPFGTELLHLRALGLIWANAGSLVQADVKCFLLNAKLSPLGYEFVRACSRREYS